MFCKLSGQNLWTGGFPLTDLDFFRIPETRFEPGRIEVSEPSSLLESNIGCRILRRALMNQLLTCRIERLV